MHAWLLFLPLLPVNPSAGADRFRDAPALAAKIDELTAKHWQSQKLTPAAPADEAAFLRRLTLDLAGRIPTRAEAVAFVKDADPDKRRRAARRLMTSPEYALHMGRVLDALLQDRLAGDADFVEYLRAAVAGHKPWDNVFREVMLGPWDTKDRKRADRFLAKRQTSLDDLTNDTARAFFGVNVSCAKCHNHPLVADWTQDHYYGMASFFARTYEAGKSKRGGEVAEKAAVEPVVYLTTKGEKRSVRTMFLSGRVPEEIVVVPAKEKKPAPAAASAGRREQLVRVALEEKGFFSRAIVNRLWGHFHGQALVQPVDQLHSANPPSVPGLLEWLADDLASHGYDLDRTVAGLVSSRAYGLDSRPPKDDRAKERDFARSLLKPLSPQEYAVSVLIALGDDSFDAANTPDARAKKYRELENAATPLLRPGLLDQRGERFQSSAGEALFLSNHADVQRLLTPSGKNLVARLAAMKDGKALADTAVWTVFGRAAEAEERDVLARWVEERPGDRAKACGQMVWALLTSAEFRFNH